MFFSFWTTTSNTDSNQLNDPLEPLVEPTLGAQPFVQMTGYSEGTLELALMGANLDHSSVGPAIFDVGELLDDGPQCSIGLWIENAGLAGEGLSSHPNLNFGVCTQIPEPVRSLVLGNDVKEPFALGEPDFNFTRTPALASPCSEIEILFLRQLSHDGSRITGLLASTYPCFLQGMHEDSRRHRAGASIARSKALLGSGRDRKR